MPSHPHPFASTAVFCPLRTWIGNHPPCQSRYAVDTFRWYICRDAIFGCDLSFSKRALVLAHNSELCNTYGNLVHRSLSLMHKYNDGESRAVAAPARYRLPYVWPSMRCLAYYQIR